jgi:ubiquinone/menaquinone biosynthesis C-methylase UbiE
MTDHRLIYQQAADKYQLLISREDFQSNLLPAIRQILSTKGLDIIDLGTGTGRLACLLGPDARRVYAFDASPHMLTAAAVELGRAGINQWLPAAADHRCIPLPASSADLVISGWSLCYLVVWEEDNWRASLDIGLQEMARLVRPNGKLVIIETLGTGVEQPQPPDKLRPYFQHLEESGFQRFWIRTDYQFWNPAEAVDLVGFFFGAEMFPKIRRGKKPVLPECTGIWWKDS